MDENRDKDMMRNQLIAVILMTVLFVAWFKWMMPTPQPKKPPVPAQQTSQQQTPQAEPAKKAETPPKQVEALWPGLPPIPTVTDPAAEEVTIGDNYLELVFTRIGGRLKRASLLLGDKGQNSIQLVPTDPGPDTEAIYPMGLHFTDPGIGDALDSRRFDAAVDPSGKAATFTITIPDHCTIRKRFSLTDRPRVLSADVDYENLTLESQVLGMDQTPAYYLNWGPNVQSGDENMGLKQALVWYSEGRLNELTTASMVMSPQGELFTKSIPAPDWLAVRSAYFVVAFKSGFDGSQGWANGDPQRFRFGLSAPRFELTSKQVQSNTFSMYLGPSEQRALAQAWDTLPQVLRFFTATWAFMDRFAKLLLWILNAFYAYIPNYGLAIIFLTILVRLAMYPLTLKSMKSMKKMQMLGPEMEELKAKCADNPQELNKKMMELYKERGVNPMGGCLPMLLQMPVFIALYRMLWNAFELRGAHFLWWMTDLSKPDHMFSMPWMAQVPFLGSTFEYFNLLPILMGLSMIVSQKVMPVSGPAQNQQQKVLMYIMPVFFSVMCYKMASGLNLYIFTSTVLGVVQQKFTRVSAAESKPKKTIGKGQHFYTAAQARKRQMAREAKKDRKR